MYILRRRKHYEESWEENDYKIHLTVYQSINPSIIIISPVACNRVLNYVLLLYHY